MTGATQRARDAYRRICDLREAPLTRDVGLLVVRLALAWIFVWHGARTLFGSFGGPGIHQASIFYGTVAHLHPATFFTVLSGGIELLGGIAVGLGVCGRLAGAGLAGDMAVAMATVTFGNGMASIAPGGGYELNLALAALGCVVAALGTGRFSLDVLARTRWQSSRHEVSHADRADRLAAP